MLRLGKAARQPDGHEPEASAQLGAWLQHCGGRLEQKATDEAATARQQKALWSVKGPGKS